MADGQISFSVVDGEPYVKVGADSPRPFKSNLPSNMENLAAVFLFDRSTTCDKIAINPVTIELEAGDYKVIGNNTVSHVRGGLGGLDYYVDYGDGKITISSTILYQNFTLSEKTVIKVYPSSSSSYKAEAWIAIIKA